MTAKYKKRSDGRYLVQIQTGIQDNGKPKFKNVYARTIKELEEKASVFRQELERGIVIEDTGLTVEKWARKWLEVYKSNREYNTIEMYRIMIEAHIIPSLGNYRLKDLKTHHVQELINQKASEGAMRTVEKIKLTLNQILNQAVKNEYVFKNVALNAEMPKKEKPQKRALTEAEKQYINKANFTLKEKAFVLTLLYTGLRRGEILALTKNDINLMDGTISVNKAVIYKSNQAFIKNSPKSDAGYRTIPLPDNLISILSDYCKTLKNVIVFTSAHNELMSLTAFRRFWDKILKQINLAAGGRNEDPVISAISTDITPHIFRHTYATTLYYAGIDMKTAQYLLGHGSIQMTLDVYTHLNNENNKGITDKLNQFVNNNNQSKISQ